MFANKVTIFLNDRLHTPEIIGPSSRTSRPMNMQQQLYEIFDKDYRATLSDTEIILQVRKETYQGLF